MIAYRVIVRHENLAGRTFPAGAIVDLDPNDRAVVDAIARKMITPADVPPAPAFTPLEPDAVVCRSLINLSFNGVVIPRNGMFAVSAGNMPAVVKLVGRRQAEPIAPSDVPGKEVLIFVPNPEENAQVRRYRRKEFRERALNELIADRVALFEREHDAKVAAERACAAEEGRKQLRAAYLEKLAAAEAAATAAVEAAKRARQRAERAADLASKFAECEIIPDAIVAEIGVEAFQKADPDQVRLLVDAAKAKLERAADVAEAKRDQLIVDGVDPTPASVEAVPEAAPTAPIAPSDPLSANRTALAQLDRDLARGATEYHARKQSDQSNGLRKSR